MLSKEKSIVIFDDYSYEPIQIFIDKKVYNNEICEYIDREIKKTDLHFIYYYTPM
jgi:hypothetical protein